MKDNKKENNKYLEYPKNNEKNAPMGYEEFKEYINTIITYEKYCNDIIELNKKYNNNNELYGNEISYSKIGFPIIITKMIKLLSKIFNDKAGEYGTIIDYFIYDLDFGESYKDGCFIDNNCIVKLDNIMNLYDYLCYIYNKSKN